MSADRPLDLVVLISGNGSNLQSILDATREPGSRATVAAVVSDRADAFGLQRAISAKVPTEVLEAREFATRADYDRALGDRIARYRPGLIVLAGFMRILSAPFVARYEGRMLNIHPALLPCYKGLHTHRRVLEAGDAWHGASVHFVTAELDDGPVVIQARVPVRPGDDPERLAARVLQVEHKIYPMAVDWFASGRLELKAGRPLLDGTSLDHPVIYDAPPTAKSSAT